MGEAKWSGPFIPETAKIVEDKPNSLYNSAMTRTVQEIFDEARQLPPEELHSLLEKLLAEESEAAFSALQKEYGEPESGYDEWFRAGVEEALADESGDIPHEQVIEEFHEAILRAQN